jgi:capsular polysaccharide biosynthesis protein
VGRIGLRRKWLIIVPFAVGLVATPLIAGPLLERYRSEAVIAVLREPAGNGVIESATTSDLANRLSSITNQIMSRSQLEQIIKDLDLYSSQREEKVTDQLIQRIRDDLHVESEGKESFRISYQHRNPVTAQIVTARLASLFVSAGVVQERAGIAPRFRIQHGATLAEKPVDDVRSAASGVGGLAGLAIGIALVLLREHRDLSFRSEDDVLRVLTLPVLGMIPVMMSEREQRALQRRRATARLVGIGLLLGFVLLLVLLTLDS